MKESIMSILKNSIQTVNAIHRLIISIHFMLDLMNFKSCRRINLLNGYATLQGITC